jgi:hypothetical protein
MILSPHDQRDPVEKRGAAASNRPSLATVEAGQPGEAL